MKPRTAAGAAAARLGLGLLAAAYLAACLLPSEPSDADLIQFQLSFDAPFRVSVHGIVSPAIHLVSNGERIEDPPPYRLVPDDSSVVQVEADGRALRGVSRGSTQVRAVVATTAGTHDTVFPVQVMVSAVRVVSHDTGYGGYLTSFATLTPGRTYQFLGVALDAHYAEIPGVPLTWSTADTMVAKMAGPGLVVAVDEGSSQVWADVDGKRGIGWVQVRQNAAAVLLAPKFDTLRTAGRTVSYLALARDSTNRVIDGAKLHWSSTDTTVAQVSSSGVATALRSGTTRIVARVGAAADTATLVVAQAVRYLFVSPASQTVTALADTARFRADARDSSGAPIPNPSVSWAVEDTSIASVDAAGLVTARKGGAVMVDATAERQTGFATLAVRQALAGVRILEDSVTLNGAGATGQLHAEGLDRNGYAIPNTDPKAFAWRSRFPIVASVDSAGMATAQGDGRTWVAATLDTLSGGADTAVIAVSGAPIQVVAFASALGITLLKSDGTGLTQLVPGGFDPAWSSDGARIAFARWHDCPDCYLDIYAAWADGSDTVNLTRQMGSNREPAWSPDGSRIAFTRESDGIYLANADGSNVTLLRGSVQDSTGYYDGYYPSHPTWSPDGTRVAFDQGCNVGLMNADGSGFRALTAGLTGCSWSPAWSPDGLQLAFVNNGGGTDDIWVINLDGSGATNLTRAFTVSDGSPPAWSPTGSQLMFAAAPSENCYDPDYGEYYCPGTPHLWVMGRDGTGITQITNGDGETHPSWRRAAPLQAPPPWPGVRR